MKACHTNLRECADATLERRQFRNAAGVALHCLQCMTCGRHTAYKVQRDGSNPPELDRVLAQQGEEACRRHFEEQAATQRQEAESARRLEYQAYLRSPAWWSLRAKIRQRDMVCQGCLSAPVEEVHHLTYDHVMAEFAFELVGLCRKCHARLHGVEA